MTNQATWERLRDFAEMHVQNGRGSDRVFLDRRGLQYLRLEHEPAIGLPPFEESISKDGRGYLRAVF